MYLHVLLFRSIAGRANPMEKSLAKALARSHITVPAIRVLLTKRSGTISQKA
jgi:hypothetical protein